LQERLLRVWKVLDGIVGMILSGKNCKDIVITILK